MIGFDLSKILSRLLHIVAIAHAGNFNLAFSSYAFLSLLFRTINFLSNYLLRPRDGPYGNCCIQTCRTIKHPKRVS